MKLGRLNHIGVATLSIADSIVLGSTFESGMPDQVRHDEVSGLG